MKRFYLYRSNITTLEYYHKFKTLVEFEKKCHDFYLLFPIWLLRNNYFDEVVIWRLTKEKREDIIFDINGKKFIQRWVSSFLKTAKFPTPDISFFRGGFKEYDELIKKSKMGTSLYLGTGKRVYPQFGGKYDVYLQEDLKDYKKGFNNLPFYKTASPHIFNSNKDIDNKHIWDICWPCNNTQWRYKGQEEFINIISNSVVLKKLKIIHCGNQSEKLRNLCNKRGIKNIDFLCIIKRNELSDILNQSRFGLCMSNKQDGCPRIVTEILSTKTPLILSEKTRLLPEYKKQGVVIINKNNAEKNILESIKNYKTYKQDVNSIIDNDLSFENICKKNINIWKKRSKNINSKESIFL